MAKPGDVDYLEQCQTILVVLNVAYRELERLIEREDYVPGSPPEFALDHLDDAIAMLEPEEPDEDDPDAEKQRPPSAGRSVRLIIDNTRSG